MAWGSILGFEYGIVQAPLGPDISGPPLVAAVANAGGLGLLRAPDQDTPYVVKELIKRTRALTSKPFGVGVVLAFPHTKTIQAILNEKVAVLHVSWGEFPKEHVEEAHRAGVKVVHQIGSVIDAEKAAAAGVDAVIVQGMEAGGHVLGQEGLFSLLPQVVDALKGIDIPIIAAGGIADARGYVAALALGAKGVCLGTRFIATEESNAHFLYKKKIVESSAGETMYTTLFGRARWPDAPQRVIKTSFYLKWKDELRDDETELHQPSIGQTVVYGERKVISRFSGVVPNQSATGDVESMVMYAGSGLGLINDIQPAAMVVRSLSEGAKNIIQQWLTGVLETSTTKSGNSTMI
ncbi:hypothetical protein KP509_34G036200 [Ceratopteris richardii]|uniref:Nitronate monooxygenase domain-containing protein n=1 Tax=Ceratopteris richardii TaxID=49495 RepID=A0A8T2QIQ1_CERRI|nr:hypothetical protein KP509_34G036200 [Ceratopteris richardii]